MIDLCGKRRLPGARIRLPRPRGCSSDATSGAPRPVTTDHGGTGGACNRAREDRQAGHALAAVELSLRRSRPRGQLRVSGRREVRCPLLLMRVRGGPGSMWAWCSPRQPSLSRCSRSTTPRPKLTTWFPGGFSGTRFSRFRRVDKPTTGPGEQRRTARGRCQGPPIMRRGSELPRDVRCRPVGGTSR